MDEKETRPEELGETAFEDIPQDPGVPGVKFPADEPGQGFEGDSPLRDEDSRRRAAEADDSLAPGSMPGGPEYAEEASEGPDPAADSGGPAH